jgi:hypothetical protein
MFEMRTHTDPSQLNSLLSATDLQNNPPSKPPPGRQLQQLDGFLGLRFGTKEQNSGKDQAGIKNSRKQETLSEPIIQKNY